MRRVLVALLLLVGLFEGALYVRYGWALVDEVGELTYTTLARRAEAQAADGAAAAWAAEDGESGLLERALGWAENACKTLGQSLMDVVAWLRPEGEEGPQTAAHRL